MTPQQSGRRATDLPTMSEPVSMKVFVGAVTTLIGAFLVWLFTTGANSVTSSARFEKDSIRRDGESAMLRRDIGDVYRATMRTDSTGRCILAKIDKHPSPFCP